MKLQGPVRVIAEEEWVFHQQHAAPPRQGRVALKQLMRINQRQLHASAGTPPPPSPPPTPCCTPTTPNVNVNVSNVNIAVAGAGETFRKSHFRLFHDLWRITSHVFLQVVGHGHVVREYRRARARPPVIFDPGASTGTAAGGTEPPARATSRISSISDSNCRPAACIAPA